MASKEEILQFKILLTAQEAVSELLAMGKRANELTTEMDKAAKAVMKFAEVNGMAHEDSLKFLSTDLNLTKQLTDAIRTQIGVIEAKAAAEAKAKEVASRVSRARNVVGDLQTPDPLDDIKAKAQKIREEKDATNKLNESLAKEAELKERIASAQAKADNAKRILELKEEAEAARKVTQALREKLAQEKLNREYEDVGWSTGNVNAQHGPAAPTTSERVGMGVAGMGAMPQDVNSMAEALKKLKAANPSATFSEIASAMRKAGADSEILEGAVKKLKPAADNAGKGFSVLRSAMGFLTAMAMSALANAVAQAFKKIIDSASQLEQAFIKIGIAERSLSNAGVDITPQALADIANSVTETYKTISSIDAIKMISNLAVLTKDLKLSEQQYRQLSLAIPLVAQQAGVSIENATDQVITGLTKSGRGWADLGITVDANIIKQEAIRMKLVANAEAYKALTAEQKQQIEVLALINILDKNTAGNLKDQEKYLNSIAGKKSMVTKVWEELATKLGILARPAIIDGLGRIVVALEQITRIAGGFSVASDGVGRLNKALTDLTGLDFSKEDGPITQLLDQIWPLESALSMIMALMTPFLATVVAGVKFIVDIFNGVTISDAAKNAGTNFGTSLILGFSQALAVGMAGEEGIVATWLKKQWLAATGIDLNTFGVEPTDLDASGLTDNPTIDKGEHDNPEVDPEDDKRQEALDKYAQELVETEIEAAQEREDIAIDLGRELADIEEEYGRKRVDINKDTEDKIRDINASSRQAVMDLQQDARDSAEDARNDELEREREYQNKLLELQENYLMDLEDALHNRDARQVLKLMQKYELDKTQLGRNHELDNIKAHADEQASQASINVRIREEEIKRDIAIRAALQERDDKLAQLAIDEKREREDAKLKADRKLADLQKANADKLALLAANLVQEYKLEGEWVKKMTELYGKYYKNVAKIYENIAKMKKAASSAQMGGEVTSTSTGTGVGTESHGGGNRHLPDKTNLKMASALPSNRSKSINTSPASFSGASGGGLVSIELLLSPDLESRIISNTLDRTAEVFTRVQRSR